MGMQMKNMKEDTFHSVLQNTVFGAVGMLLFTVLAFLLTIWFKPAFPSLALLQFMPFLCYQVNILCRCLHKTKGLPNDSPFLIYNL